MNNKNYLFGLIISLGFLILFTYLDKHDSTVLKESQASEKTTEIKIEAEPIEKSEELDIQDENKPSQDQASEFENNTKIPVVEK